jgi:hypothetical protein
VWPRTRGVGPRWVRTERTMTMECARRAASMARPVVNGYDLSHDKVFTVSTQGARQTRLTWLSAPARSEEGRRRRGRAHRCAVAVAVPGSMAVKVSPSWFGKQL